MIIKYYSNSQNNLHILDGVTDVNVIDKPELSQYSEDPWNLLEFDIPTHTDPKVISFAKDGPCALVVYGTAYICNDDGKTIEKVSS